MKNRNRPSISASATPAPDPGGSGDTGAAGGILCYSVANWSANFETHETRKLRRLNWLPLPVHHDSRAYRLITLQKDSAAIFGGWIAILQVAARCPVRGLLFDGLPLDGSDLAAMSGLPTAVFERCFSLLTAPRIGWLERVPPPASSSQYPDGAGEPPDVSGNPSGRMTRTDQPEPDQKAWNERTRPEGMEGPPVGSSDLNPSSGSGSGSDLLSFTRSGYTPVEALRHACTGSKSGDVRCKPIIDALLLLPPREALSLCDAVNIIRLEERRSTSYLVGVFRNKLGMGKDPR